MNLVARLTQCIRPVCETLTLSSARQIPGVLQAAEHMTHFAVRGRARPSTQIMPEPSGEEWGADDDGVSV